jgi:hypothetical protein
MQVSLLGLTFHEFDVGMTDVILFLFCLFFLYQLFKYKAKKEALLIFLGLTASSLFGALFHFFFPLKATTPDGFFVWSLVALSIGLIIFGALSYTVKAFSKNKKLYWAVPIIYVGVFIAHFFFVSYTYPGIILFYGPSILLLGVLAVVKLFHTDHVYSYLLGGVILSFLAAFVQVSKINIHPEYFNFNSLYHSIQLVGIYSMYLFFMKIK